MRVYHFVNQEYGLEDIKRRRLKIATLNDLNDPFELGVDSPDPAVRSAFRSLKNKLAQAFGLLCFSRDWKNPVQWSHYADRHRGLCLGFDVPDDVLTPVIYKAQLPKPDMAVLKGLGEPATEHIKQILSTKFRHWRYENEVRCFLKIEDEDEVKAGLYFAPFSDDLRLREVIVGHSSPVSRGNLVEALGDLSSVVSTCKARLAFRSYSVVRQRRDEFWP
ncbi:DUF2971 domain-containing protein [Microvirga mediterraneensis]|uniref:DUF2971 domain-containing protein n=1 Tax=Microvirga mediterraneensis TaxID=2754695 RepID=A0A838BIU2_9HYPH|nr:DUF2971 domain-containing protein [Microvirga mediterraneensis]MBA1155019.1 DUF2971 domain-containing protein [Microvirga mediterraneensis]